jgi:hypothetical protein
MLETIRKEIIDKNTFVISFIDKSTSKITPDQTNEINKYTTHDGSDFRMGLRINAMPPSVIIDIKIKYPPNLYNPNYYELLNNNEKWFQNFYNKIMNYNQTMDCQEIINDEEPNFKIKSK